MIGTSVRSWVILTTHWNSLITGVPTTHFRAVPANDLFYLADLACKATTRISFWPSSCRPSSLWGGSSFTCSRDRAPARIAGKEAAQAQQQGDGTVPQVGGDGTVPQAGTTTPGATVPQAGIRTVEEALAASPRVEIKSDSLSGSINLEGGRIDDLKLIKLKQPSSRTVPSSLCCRQPAPSAASLPIMAGPRRLDLLPNCRRPRPCGPSAATRSCHLTHLLP